MHTGFAQLTGHIILLSYYIVILVKMVKGEEYIFIEVVPCPCFSASVCQCDLVTHWAVRIDWGSLKLAAETGPGILASACHVWSTIPPEKAHSHSDAPLTKRGCSTRHMNTTYLLYICTKTHIKLTFYTISWAAMLNPLTYSMCWINSPPVCHSFYLP